MFITFEGVDGSGKTTVIEKLKKYLNSKNFEYVFTREPGSTESKEAEQIRNIILNPDNALTPMTEAILFTADRRLHLETLIWPALAQNKTVLCDRYVDSSLAYQGGGKDLGVENILQLNRTVIDDTMPDLTIFFDLKPEEAAKRVEERSIKDRMELESDLFRQKVYDGYKKVIKMFPNRFKVVDASKSREEVFNDVKKIIDKTLNL
ncbi:dTMP kinase [Candidatus Mycoplasma mahonii]|uniref:dTMP kinase n=1 Tax=Candidatus Mycoplasma mahonii TaxID=3004105 RepID=UPI0026F13DC4|nr:dTMP kinase [Candidatus Mycoplasma mahonii]WKX02607.1 dTMP kinase [Candidatus Mycoplasma mahonii]